MVGEVTAELVASALKGLQSSAGQAGAAAILATLDGVLELARSDGMTLPRLVGILIEARRFVRSAPASLPGLEWLVDKSR